MMHDGRHTLQQVPVLSLMPHSRCNCRCVMCDIWKANRGGTSISRETVAALGPQLRSLGVRWVLLSGGEALMHPNLWELCSVLKDLPAKITLLSTGLLLARHSAGVVRWCDEVIVSLDGPQPVHDVIRGVPKAFERLADGVSGLRDANPGFPVSARCVLQKRNFRRMVETVSAAHELGLDRISFLAADVSSQAFNRPAGWTQEHTDEVCLDAAESEQFCEVIERAIVDLRADFESGYVVETPDRLRRMGQYYLAIHCKRPFPAVRCNAPWVSTVVESDGSVRPCFFHDTLGNLRDAGLFEILNSETAIAFRESLDVNSNPICRRCVCTFNL